mmetsp:Transcript_129660/g.252506  ORF Transcript_129660/g.252506 Transcript_129660/m.252506 type:complete len:155 (-) Transcript_129660:317-781(-)
MLMKIVWVQKIIYFTERIDCLDAPRHSAENNSASCALVVRERDSQVEKRTSGAPFPLVFHADRETVIRDCVTQAGASLFCMFEFCAERDIVEYGYVLYLVFWPIRVFHSPCVQVVEHVDRIIVPFCLPPFALWPPFFANLAAVFQHALNAKADP